MTSFTVLFLCLITVNVFTINKIYKTKGQRAKYTHSTDKCLEMCAHFFIEKKVSKRWTISAAYKELLLLYGMAFMSKLILKKSQQHVIRWYPSYTLLQGYLPASHPKPQSALAPLLAHKQDGIHPCSQEGTVMRHDDSARQEKREGSSTDQPSVVQTALLLVQAV